MNVAQSFTFLSSVTLSAEMISAGVSQRVTAGDFNAIVLATVKTMGAVPRLKVPSFDPPVSYVSALLQCTRPDLSSATGTKPKQPERSRQSARGDDQRAKAPTESRKTNPKLGRSSPSKPAGAEVQSASKSTKPTPVAPTKAEDSDLVRKRRNIRRKATRAMKTAKVQRLNEFLVDPVTPESIARRVSGLTPEQVMQVPDGEFGPSSIGRLGYLCEENRKLSWGADMPIHNYVTMVMRNVNSAAASAAGEERKNAYSCFRPFELDIQCPAATAKKGEMIAVETAQLLLTKALHDAPHVFVVGTKKVSLEKLDTLSIQVRRIRKFGQGAQGRFDLSVSFPSNTSGLRDIGAPQEGTTELELKLSLAFKFVESERSHTSCDVRRIIVLIWRPKADEEWSTNLIDKVYLNRATIRVNYETSRPCKTGKERPAVPTAPKPPGSPPTTSGGVGCPSRRDTQCVSPPKSGRRSPLLKKSGK